MGRGGDMGVEEENAGAAQQNVIWPGHPLM